MYYITERHNAIKTVQRFLGENQTGVYSEDTRNKVIAHQAENNIELSGVVDYETFNSLKEVYLKASTARDVSVVFSGLPYKIGDMGTNIAIINAILTEVISEYTFESVPPNGSYYGNRTVDAVVRLREIFMLDYSQEIDEEFISRLLTEKNAINLSKNNR